MKAERGLTIVIGMLVVAMLTLTGAIASQAETARSIGGHVSVGDLATPAGAGEVVVSYCRESSACGIGEHTVATDDRGDYLIPALLPVRYTLYFEYKGEGGFGSLWYNLKPVGLAPDLVNVVSADRLDVNMTMPSSADVSGTVFLASAQQRAGAGDAELWLARWDLTARAWLAPERVAVTDAEGGYRVESLPAGLYQLEVRYVGAGAFQDRFWSNPGQVNSTHLSMTGVDRSAMNVTLPPMGTLSGTISLGGSGAAAGTIVGVPADGDVTIAASWREPVSTKWVEVATVTTHDGHYSFDRLKSGGYKLAVSYLPDARYLPVTIDGIFVNPPSYSKSQDILLSRGYTLAGRVSLGVPSVNAGAGEAEAILRGYTGAVVATAKTDVNGRYLFEGVPGYGGYQLQYRYLGEDNYPLETNWQTFALTDDRTDFDYTLGLGFGVRGVARDSAGTPVAGATVTLNEYSTAPGNAGSLAMTLTTRTLGDGRYQFLRLPSAGFVFTVDFRDEGAGYAQQYWKSSSAYYAPTFIKPSDSLIHTGFDAVLRMPGSVHGKVSGLGFAIDAGRTVVEVAVFDQRTRRWVETGDLRDVDDAGRFTVDGLAPDDYRLIAYYSGSHGSGYALSDVLKVEERSDLVFNPVIRRSSIGPDRDFSGDGNPDILVRSSAGALLSYHASGAGGWSGRTTVSTGWRGMGVVIAGGDFDGSGTPDMLARDSSGGLWLYGGNGHGGFVGARKVGSGWNGMTSLLGAGDFDGDLNPDVLARDASGRLWLYPGNGLGGWLRWRVIGVGWQAFTSILSAGDFNGDGTSDLLARDKTGRLWLYPGNGSGGWLGARQVGVGWGSFTAILNGGDFNGDGTEDILARDRFGGLWLYPTTGTGGWRSSSRVGSGWTGLSFVG